MNEIEYILRILLKARDETAAAFKSAREELRLFVSAVDAQSVKLDKFNESMSKMEKNMTSITEKIRDWRAAMQGLGEDNDDSAKSIARVGKETDAYVKKAAVAVKTQDDLKKQTRSLRDEVKNLEKAHEDGAVSTDHATRRYRELERQLEKTSEKMTDAARRNVKGARDQAQAIIDANKRIIQAQKDLVEAQRKADRDALASARQAATEKTRIAREANQTMLRLEREAHTENNRMEREAARERARIAKDEEQKAQQTLLRTSAANRARAFLPGAERGERDTTTVSQLKRLRSEYDQLARAAHRGSDEETHFARESERVSRALRGVDNDGKKTGNSLRSLISDFKQGRSSVAQFDNNLRGMAMLAAAGFAQQLITVLGGLVGQLVAVAGSAATAGAALGGIFVAGIAQAIPAIGLFAAALNQVKSVMQAVKQQQLERQQASVQGQQADKRNAAATDQVKNAQEGLADAQRRLKEAQANLTEERGKARRELQDLIAAENQAKLAAVGAALSQREAQQALIRAQATGDVQGIQRAQLGLLQAQADAHDKVRDSARASQDAQKARAGGVEGMPGVQDAKKSIEDAERAVAKARRGIESAKRTADEAQTGTQSAAQKLNFLLSQMTEGQRKLFRALMDLQKVYKEVFGPITDIILGSFTRAARRLIEIIQMPQLISGARKLATTMSEQLNRVFDAFTSDKMIAQFLRIAEAGRKNLKPVADIAISVGKALANIAEEAGPALSKLLGFVGDLADDFLKLTGRKKAMTDFFLEGEKHFEAWVKLGISVLRLFMALTGAGGASSGLKSVQDATKAIDDLTKKVDENRGKVGKFFEEARHITYQVVNVLVALGKELFKAFDAKRVDAFAKLLTDTLIPALGNAVRFLGHITETLLKFANTKFGGDFLKFVASMLILSKIGNSVIGPIFKLGQTLFDAGKALKQAVTWAKEFEIAFNVLGVAMEGSLLAAVGWVVLIAAIGVAVVLLLDKLGLLDDAWAAVKGGFDAAWKEIKPSVEGLVDSVMELWKAFERGQGAFALLRPILKIIIDISAVFLRVFGRTIGRILGGAIDVIKGFVEILTGILTGDTDKILDGFKDIFRGAFRAVTAGFRGFLEIVWEILKRLGPLIGRAAVIVARAFANLAKRGWNRFIDGLKENIDAIGDFLRDIATRIVRGERILINALRHLARAGWRGFINALKDAIGDIGDFLGDLRDRIIRGETRIVHAFEDLGSKAAKGFVDGISAAFKESKSIANVFIDFLNDLLPDKIPIPGAPDIKLPRNPLPHLATGGPVPGSGCGDRIHALLEPGEHVWTKGEVAAAGGHAAMFAMRSRFGGGGQSYGRRMADGGAPGAGAGRLEIDFKGGQLDDFSSAWRAFWQLLVNAARRGTNAIEEQFRDMRVKTSRSTDAMYRAVRSSLQDIQQSFRVRSKSLVDNWSDTWTSMMKITYDGLNYIGHEANRALHGFGAKTINFGLTAPPATGKAEGGFIGGKGQRGRDKGLYALGAGEAVLNWSHQAYVEPAMRAYWGFGLDDMFGRTHAYHAGGPEQPGMASGGRSGESGDTHLSRLIAAANAVNAKHLPYVWGGGHQQPAQIGHGMDCSGSVSYVTQQAGYKVPTTTSGSMGSWGFPSGPGGATIFYNPTHTFMRIGSRYFGTTGFGHPGWTGAGWFTHAPGPGYLAGFKQMHLPGISDVGDFATAIGGNIARLIVKGPESPMKEMIQNLFDKVTGAANSAISAASSAFGAGSGQDVDVSNVAAGAGPIFQFFKSHGFSDEQAAAWVGNFTQESNLRPNAVQAGGPGRGLAQWGDGRFRALVAFAGQHGKPWTDLGAQLAFVIHELSGPESAANSRIRGAKGLEAAVDAVGLGYERFGIQGDRYGPARAALARFGGHFAEGGIVPGPLGKAVPIMAHAREWILNEGQVNRVAHMMGVSRDALRSMMGFYGGPGGAAGGTEVTGKDATTAADPTAIANVTLQDLKKLSDKGLAKLLAVLLKTQKHLDELGSHWVSVGGSLANISATIVRLDRVTRSVNRKTKSTDAEKALLTFADTMDNLLGDQGLFAKLREGIERSTAIRTLHRTVERATTGRANLRATAERQARVAVRTAGEDVTDVRTERRDLQAEQRDIRQAQKRVLSQLKRGGVSPEVRQRLRGELQTLREMGQEADQRVGDNLQALYEAQQAFIQAQMDLQQKIVDGITARYDRQTNLNELARRVSTAIGGSMAAVNARQTELLTGQANELEGRIASIRAVGTEDANKLADQLEDQVKDLRVQVFELAQQSLQDGIDAINTAAQRTSGRLDLAGRLLDAMGTVGLGGAATLFGGGTFSRGGIFTQRAENFQTQRAGLVGALGTAQAGAINPLTGERVFNTKMIQDLTDQIEELDVTIAENTKAAFDARVQDVTQRHDYTQSIDDLLLQINDLNGQITGQVDQAEKVRLLTAKGLDLEQKGQELAALLAEAAPGTQQYQDLYKATLENTVAQKTNTVALNDATGALTQPQGFSSSAWSMFREAIFSGMGTVLPQYDPAMMTSTGLGSPSVAVTNSSNSSSSDTTINLYEAGRPIDLTEVAGAVTFASKTAQ